MSGHGEIYDLDETATAEPPAQAWIENAEGSRILSLEYPVTIALKGPHGQREETVSTLTIRRVKGADLRAILKCKGDEEKVLITMFVRLTGCDESIFNRLDADDIMAFSGTIEDFLQKYQMIGAGA